MSFKKTNTEKQALALVYFDIEFETSFSEKP